MSINFKDKVAIVTGAGGGLGREYALELARRGAKVVVNDLGGSRDGTGHSDAALKVVEEIESMGGEAISNGGSVTEFEQMEKMVADAKQKWGGSTRPTPSTMAILKVCENVQLKCMWMAATCGGWRAI